MKKLLPYLLVFTIAINLFAPFAIHFGQRGLKISKNEARAENKTLTNPLDIELAKEVEKECLETAPKDPNRDLCFKARYIASGTSVMVRVYAIGKDYNGADEYRRSVSVYKDINDRTKGIGDGTFITDTLTEDADIEGHMDLHASYPGADTSQDWDGRLYTSKTFKLSPGVDYTLVVSFGRNTQTGNQVYPELLMPIRVTEKADKKDTSVDQFGSSNSVGNNDSSTAQNNILPECTASLYRANLVGCAIVIYYNLFFVPTSYLFGLGGKFFDATFGYSIQDTSYRSSFVIEGWSIVRDFCNLFFIFILIYAAFGLILGVHSINSKKIVISVILIGLLINFSLFASQVIIDTSNIMARLFYNSDTIKITMDKEGGVISRGGVNMYDTTNGELPLSAALVNKVDPQSLILESSKVQIAETDGATTYGKGGLTAGSWFLVITLSTIVNIIGFFVFVSVGLVFVARVIGLWFAMILAPFAFFSYTVPKLENIKMLGWKNWWSDLLGLSFVAPIFMFFLYLILVFLQKGFASIMEASDGPNFVLSIVIPFAFIMILLMTAKKLAKDYSGQMGQMITGAVTATGAALLGGAALGAAFLGRRTVGSFMKGSATGETSVQRFARGDSKGTWDRIKGGVLHYGTFGLANRAQIATGRYINHDKHNVHEISEGRHLLDETSGKMFHGEKYDNLGVDERQQVRNRMDHNTIIRNRENVINPATGALIVWGNRKDWSEMTDDERQGIQDHHNARLAGTTRQARRTGGTETFAEQQETNARRKQSLGSTILQSSATGSYDVRNLSKLVSKELQHGVTKMGIGIISTIALGMRAGLKQGAGINHGTGQGDFFKDLGHTITEAMKSAKFKVDLSGGGGGHDDHGGGHDDHGHGGGGHH